MLTDKEIQSAIRDGDEAVMGRIMVKYAKLLWGVASAVLYGNAGDADVEDVVADAFVYFWEHPERFEPDRGKLSSYLAMVVRSRAIDQYRQITRKREVPLEEDAVMIHFEPLAGIVAKEESRKVRECLNSLNEEDREILIRRYYHEQKPREIAKALGIPKRQVENRLYQAKLKLRKQLEIYDD